MKRIAFIWLPNWPIDRLRRIERQEQTQKQKPQAEPFALTMSGSHGVRLAVVDDVAMEAGLSVGMALSDARAICPELESQPMEPEADHKALRQLVRWAGRYSPWVNLHDVEPDATGLGAEYGIKLDISGCAHLFHGEEAMLLDMSNRLDQAGIAHSIGLADNLGAACAVARFGAEGQNGLYIVPHDENDKSLAPLPVAALRLSPDICQLLSRLGLKRIGQLARVPRVALARRFPASRRGQDMGDAVLRRLDQALGRIAEPVEPMMPVPPLRARMNFAEPVTELDGLLLATEGLVDDLCRSLDHAGKKLRRMSLWLYRVDGAVSRVSAGASTASRDPAHLLRLLTEQLKKLESAGLDTGFGIELLILAADNVEVDSATQQDLVERPSTQTHEEDVSRLMDRLTSRLGEDSVGRIMPRESHRPERAQIAARVGWSAGGVNNAARVGQKISQWSAGGNKNVRPFRLLRRPERIGVEEVLNDGEGDGPPLRFRWRHQDITIRRAEGPERISPEWWPESQPESQLKDRASSKDTRDYYRLEASNGQRLWVYHSRTSANDRTNDAEPEWPKESNWYIHGFFS